MTTIELKDEEIWWIEIQEATEKTKYIITEKVYQHLEVIIIVSSINVDFQLFEGIELNAPNLMLISVQDGSRSDIPFFDGIKLNTPQIRMINLEGIGAERCFRTMFQNMISEPLLEEVSLVGTGISQIPEFILNIKDLKALTFRKETLSVLPDELFNMENRTGLRFQDCTEIKEIPDKIKKLVNLEHFDLWQANLKYLSPELFLLPKLMAVNFFKTQYYPAKEVLDAYKIYKEMKTNLFYTMPWEER